NLRKQIFSPIQITCPLVGGSQIESQCLPFVIRSVRRTQPLNEPFNSQLGYAFLHKAMSEQVAALQIPRSSVVGTAQANRDLKLFQSFLEQIHFLVGQAQVVMRLVISVAMRFSFCRNAILLENF